MEEDKKRKKELYGNLSD